MTSPDPSNIEQLTCHYAEAQQVLFAVEHPTLRQILEVMRSRDRLQTALADNPAIDSDELEKIVELDLTLKHHFATVEGDDDAFQQARLSFQPPDSAWWWFLNLKPKLVPKPKLADQFDWLWNLGTVACLVVSTAFMTQTAKAFSFKGFDVFGIASTIAQGTGLVLVAGGALTDRGHKIVGKILHDLRIPASLHAEVTFGASLVVLGSAYSIHQNLPWIGNLYLQQAKAYEDNNQFSQALRSYERALNFDPDGEMILISNGFLYEKIGELDKAIELYEKGARLGVPAFLNAKARAMLFRELEKNYWQLGADEKVLKEAGSLLERAYNQLSNPEAKLSAQQWSKDERLSADIMLNLSMIDIMRLKSKSEIPKFLEEQYPVNFYMPQEETKSQNPTQVSTLGQKRIQCFWATYHSSFDIPESSNKIIWDSQEESSQMGYYCHPFNYDPRFALTPDSNFFRYISRLVSPDTGMLDPEYQKPEKLIHSITSNDWWELSWFNDLKDLDNEDVSQFLRPSAQLKTWINLKIKTTDLIQKNLRLDADAKQDLIWRVIMNSQGQVMAYFKYDQYSLDNVDLDSVFGSEDSRKKVIQSALQDLKARRLVEFVDFKVVVSPSGKVRHILPWVMAYPSFYRFSCGSKPKSCLNRIPPKEIQEAFPLYTPDLRNTGEVAALRTMLYRTLRSLDLSPNSSFHYAQPLQYDLKVSADGQILDSKAQNSFAAQQSGKEFPRTGLEQTRYKDLQRLPITHFTIEFRGNMDYQLTHMTDESKHQD